MGLVSCMVALYYRARTYFAQHQGLLARSQTRGLAAADGGPEPCPRISVFCPVGIRGGCSECMERQGSGERLKSSRLTAHMGRNEPFNANPQWSRCCSFVRSVACPLARRFTPRHPPRGCFRYGYERLDYFVPPYPRTPSPRVGSSGRLLFGERKESSPQLGVHPRPFGFHPEHNLSRFHSCG